VGSEIIDYHVNRARKAAGTIKQQADDEISEPQSSMCVSGCLSIWVSALEKVYENVLKHLKICLQVCYNANMCWSP